VREFRIRNGNLPSGATLKGNDILQPSGTYYVGEILSSRGRLLSRTNYVVTGSSFDMGGAVPTSVTTSNVRFQDLLGLREITTSKINGTIIVDGGTHPQTEAGINSAIAAASDGDTVVLPPATYSITTGIVVNKQIKILCTSPYIGDVGQPTSGGSVLSGSGIAILTLQKDGTIVENCFVFDPVGDVATIGIDINNGATGVTDWTLRNVLIKGTDKKGTGLRLEFSSLCEEITMPST